MMTSKYRHDGLRDLELGDAVMVSKERWRKHVNELDLETFPKSWISRGLREIHHEGDAMDGRMDACLGFAAVCQWRLTLCDHHGTHSINE